MWKAVLEEASKVIFVQMAQVVVSILLLIVLLFAGLLLSYIIKYSIVKALRALYLDELFLKVIPARVLESTGIRYSFTDMIGMVFYWIGVLITFTIILNVTGLTIASELVNKIILYIPNVLIALFIWIFGIFGASLLKNIVKTIAANAGIAKADALGKASEIIAIIFVSVMGLEQLKIDITVLETAIGITLGSVGLAVVIAFGLGCKDMAGKFIAGLIEKISNPKKRPPAGYYR